MTHPTQLQLSMHADNALSAEEAVTVTEHVESCETCRASLATVRDERRFLAFARQIEAPEEAGENGGAEVFPAIEPAWIRAREPGDRIGNLAGSVSVEDPVR